MDSKCHKGVFNIQDYGIFFILSEQSYSAHICHLMTQQIDNQVRGVNAKDAVHR